uniref:Uncharacterized protein n=1 Tax=Rousettus aegyptiacus TaxID=9407 RepID=A0A7J8C2T6_ROUAE|nr:hypothetical protein HJG63_009475 [Rousettus aegyptiacus]
MGARPGGTLPAAACSAVAPSSRQDPSGCSPALGSSPRPPPTPPPRAPRLVWPRPSLLALPLLPAPPQAPPPKTSLHPQSTHSDPSSPHPLPCLPSLPFMAWRSAGDVGVREPPHGPSNRGPRVCGEHRGGWPSVKGTLHSTLPVRGERPV